MVRAVPAPGAVGRPRSFFDQMVAFAQSLGAPGLGWVPLDISSGDTAGDSAKAGRWFGGLDENRIEWAEGRDFNLEPRSKVRPDLVIRGWVEVDGKAHSKFDRVVNFQRQEQPSSQTAAR